jgi:pyrrolidone-carboxylate peptidase
MSSPPQQSNGIPVILITGFGPFRSTHTNPSWEVAKALKTYLEWSRPIHIILKQLQVTYDDVTKKVPDYWIKYNPTVRLVQCLK